MSKQPWTIRRILKHILFWAVYHLVNTTVFGHFADDYTTVFFGDLRILPMKIATSYVTIYFLIPRFILREKRYVLFFVLLFVFTVLIVLTNNFFNFYNNPNYHFYDPFVVLKYMLYCLPVIGLVVAIKFWTHWYQAQLVQERAMKEKFEAELKMLKSQIHPHFLFNTINNIYSLALEKSEKAPSALLKLSKILDYVLYGCNADKVPLEKEIDLIRNYLSLEKIRYEDRLDVMINIHGDINRVRIAPLILLTFAENSFKHGVSRMTENGWVSLDIRVEDHSVTIKMENSKNEENNTPAGYAQGTEGSNYLNGGIGLNNVRRRLDLIYGDRYTFDLLDEQNSFLILLKIELNETEMRIQT